MAVGSRPVAATRSATRSACTVVIGGSVSTTSVAPKINVLDSGDHAAGGPTGGWTPAASGSRSIAETTTSYCSDMGNLLPLPRSHSHGRRQA